MARILVIEDESNLRFSVRQALIRAGHEVDEAEAIEPAWDRLRRTDYDAVITDVNLGDGDGIDLVRRLRQDGFDGVLIVMTGYGSIESAVAAMKLGADDYLQKPVSLEELVLLVARLLDHRRLRKQVNLYQRLEGTSSAPQEIVGSSAVWRETLRLAERIGTATSQIQAPGRPGAGLPTTLILGETGTGKGVLARFIHRRAVGAAGSASSDGGPPFVHVNCSALPPSLVESELFGHEKGAFTDAKAQRTGLFEMAEGGTIFLDEIGDMPLELQAKILTVVEEGTFRRVGGSREKRVGARILAATNQDLERRAEAGTFRRDLLYRLNALTIRIPPLRERPGDALELAQAMLDRFAREFGRAGVRLDESARQAILSHDWPGNVREVVNMAQRVAMLCEGESVGREALGLGAARAQSAREQPSNGPGGDSGGASGLVFDFEGGTHTADEVERELLIQALRHTGGNVSRAAKLIGMQRSSFRYRIDRYRLESLVQEMAGR